MVIAYPHITALLLGVALDKIFGDPACLPHPIVGFGKMIALGEKTLNRGQARDLKGMFMALFLIVLVYFVFRAICTFSYMLNAYVSVLVEALLVFCGLAGTTLIKEGKAVFAALDKSLDAGRQQVGRIVGRDTAELGEDAIQAATLETLAENLSDGVIAPLFWFMIGGVPGMMAYKMVNTLDSMIGYKHERYLFFGRFAAHFDDVSNYLPARITALLMALCAFRWRAFVFIKRYGRAHSSPNAGYPEAALAGILNVQFGGTHKYFGQRVEKPLIGEVRRAYTPADLRLSIRTMKRVEMLFVLLCACVLAFTRLPL